MPSYDAYAGIVTVSRTADFPDSIAPTARSSAPISAIMTLDKTITPGLPMPPSTVITLFPALRRGGAKVFQDGAGQLWPRA